MTARLDGREQVSEAHEVLNATRASDRQRHNTVIRIRHARREGRLSQSLCDVRLLSAAEAVTTAQLEDLTRDLGSHEGTHPVRTAAVVCSLITLVPTWAPVLVSSIWWVLLAVPVTLTTAYVIWVLPDYLT